MSLTKKLVRWQAAGLIDAATAARIAEHENQNARPFLLYALGGLGALTIGVGFISLVAANWDEIPRAVKWGLDVLLLGGLSAGIFRAKSTGHRWVCETLIVLQYVLTLASIALVGQVYQLGGQAWAALLFWTVITAPLMAVGESAFVAVTWVSGAYLTKGVWLFTVLDDWRVPNNAKETIFFSAMALVPLVTLVLGTLQPLARVRPAFTGAFWRLGWFALIGLASVAQFGWYAALNEDDMRGIAMAAPALLVLAGAVAWAMGRVPHWQSPLALRAAQAVLGYAVLSSLLPFIARHESVGLLAALSFIALWAMIGFAAYHSGHLRWLNLATAVIAMRVIAIYIELFSSLADTGFFLIGGGLLTIGLTWLWIRKSKDFRAAAMAQVGKP